MRLLFAATLLAASPAFGASFECQRNPDRIEKMICADAVVSDLDEVMARFYAGAVSALRSNAVCLKPDQQDWLRRLAVKDGGAPLFDRRHCIYLYRSPR